MTKKILIVAILVFECISIKIARASSYATYFQIPRSESELLESVQNTLKNKDLNNFFALYYWDGVSESMRDQTINSLKNILENEIESIQIESLVDENSNREIILGNVKYRPTLPISGYIKINFLEKQPVPSIKIPFGIKDQHHYLNTTLEEKLENTIPTISISINIAGLITPQPVAFKGYYIYLQNQEEIKKIFAEDKGNLSLNFYGNKIKYFEIQRTSNQGWFQVTILENGKIVFSSDKIESNESIIYKAE